MEIEDPSSLRRKKIVALSDHTVFPPVRGGELRVFNLLKHLQPWYRVDLVSSTKYFWKGTRSVCLGESFREISVPQNPAQVGMWLLASRFGKDPITEIIFAYTYRLNPALKNSLRQVCGTADYIVVERPCLFPVLARQIKSMSNKPIIYDAHDVFFLLKESIVLASPLRRVFLDKARELEELACSMSDMVFTACEDDRQNLTEIYSVPGHMVRVIPNGFDSEAARPVPLSEKMKLKAKLGLHKRTVVFVGSDHPPNVEAAQFIISRLAPDLKQCQFVILGRAGLKVVKKRAPDNVLLLGFVDEGTKCQMLQCADVAVNPVSSGSGTNVKMLEYMAYELPIVSTPEGLRGLDLKDGTHVIMASRETFGRAVLDVMENQTFSRSLGENSRSLLREKYDWRVISQEMHENLQELDLRRRSNPKQTGF